MLWFPEWKVLVVDDDPDVLHITELALRHVEVEGVPVHVYTASSKAEAIEIINNNLIEPSGMGLLTVALIDVVMETDTAGLELCDYIRNTLGNSTAQLYIRTGQPGIAPERGVIDDFDITGYFTKVEATEDKLYTMVKSGVRQFVLSTMSAYNSIMINATLDAALVSQEHVENTLSMMFGGVISQRESDSVIAIWIDGTPVVSVGLDHAQASAMRDRLLTLPATPLSPAGETVHVDIASREGIIRVPAGASSPSVDMLGRGHSVPRSNFVHLSAAWILRAIGMVWQSAGQREYAD